MGWGTGLSFPPPTPYCLNDEEYILTRLFSPLIAIPEKNERNILTCSRRSIRGFLTLTTILCSNMLTRVSSSRKSPTR